MGHQRKCNRRLVRRLNHLEQPHHIRIPLTIALRAYRQSDRAHQAHLDIDINASGNTDPKGIYYDGSTFYVTDGTDDKVYAYNTPPSTDATLSALTVSPKNIIGFDPTRTSYEVGVASTVTQATIAATANDLGATVAITPADAVDTEDGHQVALSAGRNAVTITVTAEDTTTKDLHRQRQPRRRYSLRLEGRPRLRRPHCRGQYNTRRNVGSTARQCG